MTNFSDMLSKAKAMQEKMKEAQEQIKKIEVEGVSGGNLVKVYGGLGDDELSITGDGNGLSKLAGKVFRIGHLGDFNDLMLLGTLSGVEMGLSLAGIPHQRGGVETAMQTLSKYSK